MISDKIHESESLQRIAKPLLAWYGKNCRDLEWRKDPLPYYVWVSEIMLQQTRVEAVKPYFSRFIRELPDIAALARCPEEKLLKLWEGLGYYSRVRNLQKAARMVMSDYGGSLPDEVSLLLRLPGIGPYTAGAIASIAFQVPAPAVDGNVLRVLSRITGSTECIDDPGVRKAFEEQIRTFLEKNAGTYPPGQFNQALMELGAVICLPNGVPCCDTCPAGSLCLARKEGRITDIPVRLAKKARRIQEMTVLVIRDQTRMVIGKRPARGLLAGLWELPNAPGHLTSDQALVHARRLGVPALRIRPLPEETHIFTHVEWRMSGYLILAEEMEETPLHGRFLAADIAQIEREYSIPAAFARYVKYLDK
ncbi:MAG TPA: A/G-specific adenine glycosylase [Lachnospiraceae bacterium]|nr:A/G-specific adenine glycosylase [Lachnospiraceae bacterium]